MKNSIVVYGLQGCGKTNNQEKLKERFRLNLVVDDWCGGEEIPDRALILTNKKPPYAVNVAHVAFSDAMKANKGNTVAWSKKVSSGEVAGVIARYVMRDFKVNSFTFTGFPEIGVDWDDALSCFYICLKHSGFQTAIHTMSIKDAKREIKNFHEDGEINKELMLDIQKMTIALEGFL